jgi:hypothetical protein
LIFLYIFLNTIKSALNPFIDMFDENSWDLSYYSSSSVNDWDENNFLQRSLDRKGSFYIEELDGSPNY